MTEEHARGTDAADLSVRRERVVEAVLARIADAERAVPAIRPPSIDLVAWTVPVLAAASVILLISGRVLLAPAAAEPASSRVAEWLGLPSPVTRYLETGEVSAVDWLDAVGGRP